MNPDFRSRRRYHEHGKPSASHPKQQVSTITNSCHCVVAMSISEEGKIFVVCA
ncbi:hypothetical protein F441_07557 [Phytophthora nicotianae CJ01A1]|uniref:Uncharacterized protein n=2 Tax=Phytophthora nicotianae TaxID=4792 RepID=W2X5Z0_PHYNI|nr:hypothetical protein L914_19745 [Phytophthora nicotianae]ETP18186.1 hypothetical protein F441_07557 [Phytophthora nicotianae CJ01A1]